MKLQQKWVPWRNRSREIVVREFMKGWNEMLLFCSDEPLVPFRCYFLCDLHLQVQCYDISQVSLFPNVCLKALDDFASLRSLDPVKMQKEYVNMWLASGLNDAFLSTATVQEILKSSLEPFLMPANSTEVEKTLISEISDFVELVQPRLYCWSADQAHHFEKLVKLAGESQSKLIGCLSQFQRHGKPIIKACEEALVRQQKCLTFLDEVRRQKEISSRIQAQNGTSVHEVVAAIQGVPDTIEHFDTSLTADLLEAAPLEWTSLEDEHHQSVLRVLKGSVAINTPLFLQLFSGDMTDPQAIATQIGLDTWGTTISQLTTVHAIMKPRETRQKEAETVKAALKFLYSWCHCWADLGQIMTGEVPAEDLLMRLNELCNWPLLEAWCSIAQHEESLSLLRKIKEFHSAQIQVKVAQGMEMRMAEPLKQIMSMYEVALKLIKVLATNQAVESTEVQELMHEAAGWALDSNLRSIEGLAVGYHATARSQCLSRLLTTFQLIARMRLPAEFSQERVEHLGKISVAIDSLDTWIDSNKQHFFDINAGWFADAHNTEMTVGIGRNVIRACLQDWGKLCDELAATCKDIFPTKSTLDDAALLSDGVVQSTFMKTMASEECKNAVADISHWLHLAKLVNDMRLDFPDTSKLKKMRHHTKKCAGAEFVLISISSSSLPKKRIDLPKHVDQVIGKLAKKGMGPGKIELPTNLWKVLLALKENKAA